MDITEQQIMEALGVGAKEPEPAEPAATPPEDQGDHGANEQEPAGPADPDPTPAEEETGGSGTEDDGSEGEPAETDKEPMSPEKRRENAARRRQAQQQAAIDAAVADALKAEREKQVSEMTAFFAKAGLKNTITGKPITTMKEFREWNEAFEEQKLQRELKNGKLTTEGLAAAIGKHPVVQQAQALLQKNEQEAKSRETAAAQERINAEIAQIHEIDHSISTIEDLTKASYWPQLYAMTKRGYSLKDAHFLLNHERLEQAKTEAARQAAMANARGKEHLKGSNPGQGGGAVAVPAAEMAVFRALMPKASDAEIQNFYNKHIKGKR